MISLLSQIDPTKLELKIKYSDGHTEKYLKPKGREFCTLDELMSGGPPIKEMLSQFLSTETISQSVSFKSAKGKYKAKIECIRFYEVIYEPEEFIKEIGKYNFDPLSEILYSIESEYADILVYGNYNYEVIVDKNDEITAWVKDFSKDKRQKYGERYLYRARRAELACIEIMRINDLNVEDVSASEEKDKYDYDLMVSSDKISLKIDVKSAKLMSELGKRVYNYPFYKKFKENMGDEVILFGCFVSDHVCDPILPLGLFGETEEKKIKKLIEGHRFIILDDDERSGKIVAPWAFSFDLLDDFHSFDNIFEKVDKLREVYLSVIKDENLRKFNNNLNLNMGKSKKIIDYFDKSSDNWETNLKRKIYHDRSILKSASLYIVIINIIFDLFSAIKEGRENFNPVEYRKILYPDFWEYKSGFMPGFSDPMGLSEDILHSLTKLYNNHVSRKKIIKYYSIKFNGQLKIKGSTFVGKNLRWTTIIDHCYQCGKIVTIGDNEECERCMNLICDCQACFCE